MSTADWLVLVCTLLSITLFGVWKSRGSKNMESYLLADRRMAWYQVGLSVMATQASAITFLSAPGLGFGTGLRFVQFYFGLPLAMIVVCALFVPAFSRMHVFTAYEYLEHRFDIKTRLLTSALFLLQRGLSTGITIYAPAMILSTILHVPVVGTTIFMGAVVTLYTVFGGTKAVAYTQSLQMLVIFSGLAFAGFLLVKMMPPEVHFSEALHIAGAMGRVNALNTSFDWHNDYNIWSGIIGGFFLQLSYFGTDQSQVGRYLTGKSTAESRMGLIMNGLIKIPMQFCILLLGVLLFTFYQFHPRPLYFNAEESALARKSAMGAEFSAQERIFAATEKAKSDAALHYAHALRTADEAEKNKALPALRAANAQADSARAAGLRILGRATDNKKPNDTNYVFLHFVVRQMPAGLVGLIIAIIFLAAMGSTASGMNSLASATVVDFYKRLRKKPCSETHYLRASRAATVCWGVFCVLVGIYAGKLGNLMEVVNILGSLFYGTILGIFLTAFLLKSVRGTSVFIAAAITECGLIVFWYCADIAFLWLNVAGCLSVMLLALLIQVTSSRKAQKA